jgi:predicted aspartyl protease
LLLILVGCSPPGPARVETAADSAAGESTFELAGPGGAALIVPVHINGQGPFDFVLDTGATLTCIDQRLASRLALPEVTGVVGVGAGIGSSGRLKLAKIDSLRIGQTSAHDVQGCVLNLENLKGIGLEPDGLVGLNVLKEFRVTLDFERNVVRLE